MVEALRRRVVVAGGEVRIEVVGEVVRIGRLVQAGRAGGFVFDHRR